MFNNSSNLRISLKLIASISLSRKEPKWMYEWRVNSFYCWLFMVFPAWDMIDINCFNKLNFKLYDVDYDRITQTSKANIDIIHDSSSVYLSLSKELKKIGVMFLPLAKAILLYPKYIRRYMSSVVSHNDNYFSALNGCVFTDGTFVLISKGVKCPIALSTYFKINRIYGRQFERTLIILENQSSASYFESHNSNELNNNNNNVLHSAVVEIVIKNYSVIKYSSFQSGSGNKKCRILNLDTKRALCIGNNSRITWIQIEVGVNITWKYPSIILLFPKSSSKFYSFSMSDNYQCVDTGSSIYHLANGCESIVLAKSVVLSSFLNAFKSYINIRNNNCKNYTKCSSLLLSNTYSSYLVPVIHTNSHTSIVQYKSVNSYATVVQMNHCKQKRLNKKNIINNHAYDIFKHLPLDISPEIIIRLLFIKL